MFTESSEDQLHELEGELNYHVLGLLKNHIKGIKFYFMKLKSGNTLYYKGTHSEWTGGIKFIINKDAEKEHYRIRETH